MGDLNGDGRSDIITANLTGNSVTVLLTQPTGNYASQSYSVGGGPRSVTLGDLNGDGRPDIVTTIESLDNVRVLLAQPTGGYTSQHYVVGDTPQEVAVGDLDGNGRLDIVTANIASNDVAVLLNAAPLAITQQPPTSSSVCAGTNVSVPISVTGSVIGYQWYKDNTLLTGQTSATLTLSNVQTTDAGSYSLVITGICNNLTTTAFDLAVSTPPTRLYVKADANGANTGLSWTDAFTDLQSALNYNCSGRLTEIWVARGTYKPTTGTNRGISFSMRNNVAIYGGFAGREDNLNDRQLTYPSGSILSGEIGQPGNADNSLHVIFNNSGLANSAILDGFIITGGNANGTDAFDYRGGGILNISSNPTITNCSVVGNAGGLGGGIHNQNSSPILTNCNLEANYTIGSFSQGGAIYNIDSSPSLTNCSFLGNSAVFQGSALYNAGSTARLTNCSLQGNSSPGWAILNGNSSTSLINCVVWGNVGTPGLSNDDASVTASYSLFNAGATGYVGTNNRTTTVSPFVSASSVALNACAPAINAGSNDAYIAANGPTSDLVGAPRIVDNRIDMGAVEFPGTPNNPIAITQQPASSSVVCEGATVTAMVSVSGTSPVYQWYKDGQALANQTSATLSLPNVTTANTGSYSVVITGACNSLTSSAFSLTVNARPVVTVTNPAAVCAPATVNLNSAVSVNVTGSRLAFFTDVTGSTALANPSSVTSSGTYYVQATSPAGCASEISPIAVMINFQPTVTLDNDGPLTCAKPSVTLLASPATSLTFVFSGGDTPPNQPNTAKVTNDGLYSVTVTNANGCSATATTQVTSNTAAPENVNLTNNGPLSFTNTSVTLNATAGAGYSYSFSQGADQQGNGYSATVTTAGVYSVTVTRQDNGCTATASTTVAGGNNPTVCRGGTAVINVVAEGDPIRYEWYKNSLTSPKLMETPQLFRGTATSSLTLINAQTNTQGNFFLKVTDRSGTVRIYGPYRLTVDANCRAREVAQLETPLRIELAPNPIQQDRLLAVVRGAEGRSLQVELVDLSGKPIRQQQWSQAEQRIDWDMQGQTSGIYLLQILSEASADLPAQRQRVKVIKP
ncbi:hypothetical protein GCM10027341_51290 [Spirosoma knui]